MAEHSYDAARQTLAEQLLRDASAHDAGRFDEIGRRFDSIEHGFPRGADVALRKLRVAMTFWDGWIDARNHGWQTTRGIQPGEWPELARGVATDLLEGREIASPRVREYFDAVAHASLGGRAGGVADRLRPHSQDG